MALNHDILAVDPSVEVGMYQSVTFGRSARTSTNTNAFFSPELLSKCMFAKEMDDCLIVDIDASRAAGVVMKLSV